MRNFQINTKLIIPNHELQWRFSRSSGPGGQNVNKTESRVELIFNIQNSQVLNPFQKYILLEKLKNKLRHNAISITVQEKRTQYENRELAIYKLHSLIREKLKPEQKSRKKTKPTKGSQKRRIELKKKRGVLKQNRNFKPEQDL